MGEGQRQRNRRGKGIAELCNASYHLLTANIELVGDGIENAGVGLVWNKPIHALS
jgi:hypothetical protein